MFLFLQNLVELASVKILECNKTLSYSKPPTDHTSAYSMELSQRSSLPDIPLTPRERQILEQTSLSVIQHHLPRQSLSSESILQDNGPPPKPPLPIRSLSQEYLTVLLNETKPVVCYESN